MKHIFFYGWVSLALTSCLKSDDIKPYDGATGIYFASATDPARNWGKDSLTVSFALTANERTDSLIKIPVRIMGNTADVDRVYQVRLASGSTATEGVHFDFHEESFTIPAGRVDDSLQVILHRTGDLKNDTVRAVFELVPNENFVTLMLDEMSTDGKRTRFTQFRLYANDILPKPESWLDFYLGNFTAKKFYLLGDVLGIDLAAFSGSAFSNVTFEELRYYGIAMQRYLNRKKADGEPVYDEDNQEMVMGAGAQ